MLTLRHKNVERPLFYQRSLTDGHPDCKCCTAGKNSPNYANYCLVIYQVPFEAL